MTFVGAAVGIVVFVDIVADVTCIAVVAAIGVVDTAEGIGVADTIGIVTIATVATTAASTSARRTSITADPVTGIAVGSGAKPCVRAAVTGGAVTIAAGTDLRLVSSLAVN